MTGGLFFLFRIRILIIVPFYSVSILGFYVLLFMICPLCSFLNTSVTVKVLLWDRLSDRLSVHPFIHLLFGRARKQKQEHSSEMVKRKGRRGGKKESTEQIERHL